MPWRGQFTYRTYHMNHSGLPYAGNFHATRLDRKGVLHGAVDVGVPGKAGALARALVAEAAAGAGLGLHRAGAVVDLSDGSPALAPTNRVLTMDASSYLMDPREVDIGDRIRVIKTAGTASAAEVWETRTIDSVTYSTETSTSRTGQVASFVTEYGYSTNHANAAAYNDGSGTMEAKSCSGRGLCDESTGECACFSGYTDVDCSVQNALAI